MEGGGGKRPRANKVEGKGGGKSGSIRAKNSDEGEVFHCTCVECKPFETDARQGVNRGSKVSLSPAREGEFKRGGGFGEGILRREAFDKGCSEGALEGGFLGQAQK